MQEPTPKSAENQPRKATIGPMKHGRDDLMVLWNEGKAAGWAALPRGMRLALIRQGLPDVQRLKSGVSMAMARASKKTGLLRSFVRMGNRRLVTLSWASDVPAFPDAYWSE